MMIAEQFVGGAHGVYEARGLIELLINKMTGGWLVVTLPTLSAHIQKAGDWAPKITKHYTMCNLLFGCNLYRFSKTTCF